MIIKFTKQSELIVYHLPQRLHTSASPRAHICSFTHQAKPVPVFVHTLPFSPTLSLRKLFCILTARLISQPSLPRLNEKAIRMHVNAVPMAAPARFSTSTPHCFTFSTASFCLSVRSPLLSPLPLSSVAAASLSFPHPLCSLSLPFPRSSLS